AAMAEMIGVIEDLAESVIGSILLRFTAAFSYVKALYAIRYATDRKAPTLYASPVGAGYCLVPKLVIGFAAETQDVEINA
ncbi:hypothetical protein ACC754_43770, partial [Rhizobium johnstonii]